MRSSIPRKYVTSSYVLCGSGESNERKLGVLTGEITPTFGLLIVRQGV